MARPSGCGTWWTESILKTDRPRRQLCQGGRYGTVEDLLVGLPLEEDSDIDELIRFTTELSRILPVALGVSPFVAKRNTPLDGAPFAGIKEVEHRLERLRRGLRGRAKYAPLRPVGRGSNTCWRSAVPKLVCRRWDVWRGGASFAAWKRAFEARGAQALLGTASGKTAAATQLTGLRCQGWT